MHTFKVYMAGFALSLVLTLTAYFAVALHVPVTLWVILALAFVQLLVQLVFFLHLGEGKDGRWSLAILFSTACVIFILVAGSIWIMNHLNYNMSPQQMNDYMMKSEGFMQ